jgi:hypothetical protein
MKSHPPVIRIPPETGLYYETLSGSCQSRKMKNGKVRGRNNHLPEIPIPAHFTPDRNPGTGQFLKRPDFRGRIIPRLAGIQLPDGDHGNGMMI